MTSWLSTISNYLQPHDAKQRVYSGTRILEEPAASQAERQANSHLGTTKTNTLLKARAGVNTDSSPRNRNKLLFSAGMTFFAFSLLVTRRSFARRRAATSLLHQHQPTLSPASSQPGTLTNHFTTNPSHTATQSSRVSPSLEALEALNIATINVVSVAMMAVGGALWYLDIDSVEDARRLLRGGLGVDGSGRSETEAEEEMEEWMARVLSRGEQREQLKDSTPQSLSVSATTGRRILDER